MERGFMDENAKEPVMFRDLIAPRRLMFAAISLAWALPAAAVDINSADAGILAEELTGVGEVRAEAIIKYREDHGPFESVGELTEVRGIGSATLEKNRDSLALGTAEE
jgi:competence protein ComEA